MARTLHYGSDEILIQDDRNVPTILKSIEEAANSGEARWVEIHTEGDPHRILIQKGVSVWVEGTYTPGVGLSFV